MAILALASLPRGAFSAPTQRVIRVATIAPRLVSLPQLVTADLLSDKGIRVEWSFLQSDGAVTQALVSKAVDFAITNAVRVGQMHEQGGQVRMLTVSWGTLDWVFVARDEIRRLSDLSGKRVGISSPGSTTDLLFRRMMHKRSLFPENMAIAIFNIGGTGARAAALLAGRIDASWLGYDAAYEVMNKGRYLVVENVSVAKEFPDYVSTAWNANLEYIRANRQIAREVVRAQILANRWAQDGRAFIMRAARSDIPAIRELDRKAVEWAYARFIEDRVFPLNGGLNTRVLAGTLAIGLEGGEIKRIPLPREIALFEIQDEVLSELGIVRE